MSEQSTPPEAPRRGRCASKKLPPAALLRKHLAICEGSPSGLIWTVPTGYRAIPGRMAGHELRNGYWHVGFMGKTYLTHRIMWAIATGVDPGDRDIDHVNGKWNIIHNLRLTTRKLNSGNRIGTQRHDMAKGSAHKGVRLQSTGRWGVGIGSPATWLGTFDTESEAARAYNRAAIERWGDSARLNSIEWPGHTWSWVYVKEGAPESARDLL